MANSNFTRMPLPEGITAEEVAQCVRENWGFKQEADGSCFVFKMKRDCRSLKCMGTGCKWRARLPRIDGTIPRVAGDSWALQALEVETEHSAECNSYLGSLAEAVEAAAKRRAALNLRMPLPEGCSDEYLARCVQCLWGFKRSDDGNVVRFQMILHSCYLECARHQGAVCSWKAGLPKDGKRRPQVKEDNWTHASLELLHSEHDPGCISHRHPRLDRQSEQQGSGASPTLSEFATEHGSTSAVGSLAPETVPGAPPSAVPSDDGFPAPTYEHAAASPEEGPAVAASAPPAPVVDISSQFRLDIRPIFLRVFQALPVDRRSTLRNDVGHVLGQVWQHVAHCPFKGRWNGEQSSGTAEVCEWLPDGHALAGEVNWTMPWQDFFDCLRLLVRHARVDVLLRGLPGDEPAVLAWGNMLHGRIHMKSAPPPRVLLVQKPLGWVSHPLGGGRRPIIGYAVQDDEGGEAALADLGPDDVRWFMCQEHLVQ